MTFEPFTPSSGRGESPSRRNSLTASAAVHVAAVGVLLALPTSQPDFLAQPLREAPRVVLTALPTQPPALRREPLERLTAAPPRPLPAAATVVPPREPRVKRRALSPAEAPQVAVEAGPRIELPPPEMDVPAPLVREAGFAAAAAHSKPPSEEPSAVRTGQFGSTESSSSPTTVRAIQRSGFGAAGIGANRTAGPSVKTAGFGSTARRESTSAAASVERGGFAAARVAAPVEMAAASPRDESYRPVRILAKPKPDYTPEAAERRIEGEVALLVRFLDSGRVEVLQVLEGLGYGLDESARRAAEAIRFEPAERFGRPVAETATVRISFQMAY